MDKWFVEDINSIMVIIDHHHDLCATSPGDDLSYRVPAAPQQLNASAVTPF